MGGFILSRPCPLSSRHTQQNMPNMCVCVWDDWRGREWKSEWSEGFFCSRAPTALHIFHFPASWKDQVIEKETIQQPRLHRCQWKASEILEYYTLGPVFVFLSHGANGKKWLCNDNTWKVLSIRLMHHCQRGRWNCIVSFWMADINGETAGRRERGRWSKGREGRMEECNRDVVRYLNAKYIQM